MRVKAVGPPDLRSVLTNSREPYRNSLRNAYAEPTYDFPMTWFLLQLMRVLEVLFFVGLAGSAVVVLISFVEDFGVLLHRDE